MPAQPLTWLPSGSSRPTCVDLFGGAGGLSLGFEQAGFDVLATVEYDPVHGLVHRRNFPDCEVLCRDVKALSGEDVLAAAERIDPKAIADLLLIGELGLDGGVRPVRGVLPAVLTAADAGYRQVVVP